MGFSALAGSATTGHHPGTTLLMEYASGSLSLAPCIAVSTHLQFCSACRHAIGSLAAVGGELLATGESASLSPGLLDDVLTRLDEEPDTGSGDAQRGNPAATCATPVDEVVRVLPRYVRNLLPHGALTWRTRSPSLRVSPIPVGETRHELALHRIRAGGTTPRHDHRGIELTVVLKGSFSDEDGVYHAGDFMVREPGEIHRPLAAQHEECICLSVLSAPIRMTGIKRVFNLFLRFAPA